jgi:predicted nucleotide-binding protein
MKLFKKYSRVRFPVQVLNDAKSQWDAAMPSGGRLTIATRVEGEDETWSFDTWDEFIYEYGRSAFESAHFHATNGTFSFVIHDYVWYMTVEVGLPEASAIKKVMGVFDSNYEQNQIPTEAAEQTIQESVTIFIGHGRDKQWRDLKDHLSDKHGFQVEAYESGERAGFTIAEILDELSEEASFALLVHTGEDLAADGTLHARENVVHETGLFQGKLGFKRAIVLLEEGCNEFSNLAGVQQIRFSKGSIRETFGDVLATIYREFGATED